jgi:transcription-repair coupling factor (superfamily II helicase)
LPTQVGFLIWKQQGLIGVNAQAVVHFQSPSLQVESLSLHTRIGFRPTVFPVKIQDILKAYREHPDLIAFSDALQKGSGSRFQIKGALASAEAFLLAGIAQQANRNMVVVLNDKEDALYFLNDLQALMPRKEILFFPASYKRPYQIDEIDNANVLQRAEVLNQLNHTASGRQLIITFAEALSEQVVNKRSLVKNTLDVKKGEQCGMDFIVDVLEDYGFEETDFVWEPGQFAKRGGILDVFSFAHELPYRIEFFGEEVDSIRSFDPVDQMSKEDHAKVSLIPNIQKNLINEERVHFLDYLTDSTLLFVQNVDFIEADLDRQFGRAEKSWDELMGKSGGAALSRGPESLYTSGKAFLKSAERLNQVEFGTRFRYRKTEAVLEWECNPQPAFKKEFPLLAKHLHDNYLAGVQNFIFSDNPKQFQRLQDIFKEIDHEATFSGVEHAIHRGFLDRKLRICCYTDHEIFERYHRFHARAQAARSQALTLKELQDLVPGDYVTHITHGIGRFAGLHRIKVGPNEQEAIKVIYQDGDEIYVNVNSLYKISKYAGGDANPPKLSKLGSGDWARKKAKTKSRIKELAFDLIALYAQRKAQNGFACESDSYLQQELEASFMYEDTPDQVKATEDVKRDMESRIPMDRLVCGDVGFGKTEIAVRAAFKAAVNGKQVAMLVPTTILAIQHFHTFRDRLADFPVTVEFINRFKSAKEEKDILERLEAGKIDILIGTHRIVGKDVKFKDLGLLIIDEEQKFGVGVKEKLKLFKVNVDTLTLTATPIPRTLQFSLMGVRDLSVLATPPPNRQPVETVVTTFDQATLRDAVAYEMKRGGQVFFIHNRIADLDEMGSLVKKLVPDARVGLAHGQLAPAKMEQVMANFIEGEYDVLMCTTIVESGLDIPNANTIIINEAHNYGLSDLHQMRGRVGRSNRKAFCYLFAPHETLLSRDARKRLKAIAEFSDLGSGFHIALKDLDIRGAGDLLGAEQSGFINEVGYEMYQKILEEAIHELKEEQFPELFKEELAKQKEEHAFVDDCLVETDLNILIPESYLPVVSERLNFYNKIAGSRTEEEFRLIQRQLIDRFGPIPAEVLGLFDTVRIRQLGRPLGFEKVVLNQDLLRLYFPSDKTSSYYSSGLFPSVLSWVQANAKRASFKESPKYLSLQIKPVSGIKEAWAVLKEIQTHAQALMNIHGN